MQYIDVINRIFLKPFHMHKSGFVQFDYLRMEQLPNYVRLLYALRRFWCQLIYDGSLHHCIDSYLSGTRRPYDIGMTEVSSEVQERQMTLHRLFFLVCLRSSTHHESPTDFIDGKVFGDILYENFIFDIPKLMDICVVYGHGTDAALVSKMIGNIFQQQPKYNDDLRAVVPTIQSVFDTLCSKCGAPVEASANTPPKLSATSKPLLESMPASEFEDIILYLSDIANSLNFFLKIYPPGASAFWNSPGFLVRLATAYEYFAIAVPAAFRRRTWDDVCHAAAVKRQFRRSQVCLLRVFRLIIYHSCLRPVGEGSGNEAEVARGIEEYVDIVNMVLAEKHFIGHLHVLFPFDDDRRTIVQSSYLVDEPRLQYIEDAFKGASERHSRKRHEKLESSLVEVEKDVDVDERFEFEGPDEDDDVAGANFDSMVSAVRDLLPELGAGFVELCLEEFAYDVEKVINALLENNLPPNLQGVDQSLENAHNTSAGVSDQSSSLLNQRKNVYDGDEFDVFSRSDIDMEKIHQGKRDKNDMQDVSSGGQDPEIRDRCVAYALLPASAADDDLSNVWEYDDEYDDTYDSNVVGAGDADSADELLSRRPFVVPRIFTERREDARYVDRNYDGNEEEDTGESAAQAKPRDVFVEDPAVVRQRREQQWANQQQQRSARRRGPAGRGGGSTGGKVGDDTASNSDRRYDVKGVARGQGQSTEVVHNRAWKEKNKASRVHHNRKDLADRKRRF